MDITYGLCHCGCGKKTDYYSYTDKRRGQIKGNHRRFIRNHHLRGKLSLWWNGGVCVNDGYVHLKFSGHPKTDGNGYVQEHVLITESVIGKYLPKGAVIHHVNGNEKDNSKNNLVICQNQAYHVMLHSRENALRKCGHADWFKCKFCHKYDDPKNLFISNRGNRYHRYCHAKYERERRNAKLKSI